MCIYIYIEEWGAKIINAFVLNMEIEKWEEQNYMWDSYKKKQIW